MLICLDLETTGLDVKKDKIIEIAMVKFDETDFSIIDTYETLIYPDQEIPLLVQNITGISEEDVLGAPLFSEVRQKITDFIGNTPIVGHNINFDISFLQEAGIAVENNIRIDTFLLANFLNYDAASLNLEMLCKNYNISFLGAHRAVNDVHATISLFEAQIKNFSSLAKKKQQTISYILSRSVDINIVFLCELLFRTQEEIPSFGDIESSMLRSIQKNQKPAIDKHDDNKKKIKNLEAFLKENNMEQRENQQHMSHAIDSAFSEADKHLCIQAPTGVGKTFAYLVPAALFAIENNAQVYIATKTKALQDQLFSKDLEFLSQNIGTKITYTKLKGKNNYVHIGHFFQFLESGDFSYDEVSLLLKIAMWLYETRFGEFDELHFYPSEYLIKNQITANNAYEHENPYKKYEFLDRARNSVKSADIIVINHSLLFSELQNTSPFLPEIKHLIVDEAHGIEDSITDALKQSYNGRIVNEYLENCQKEFIKSKLKSIGFMRLKESLLSRLDIIDEILETYIYSKTQSQQKFSTVLIKNDFYDGVELDNYYKKINLIIVDIIDTLRTNPELNVVNELSFFEKLGQIIKILCEGDDNKEYIKIGKMHPHYGVSFEYTLKEPGVFLGKNLWSGLDTCVLTSATISIGDDFSYVKNLLHLESFEFLRLESDFDYSKQATLFIPTDLGDIKTNGAKVIEFLGLFYSIVGGSVLTLLTSFSMIQRIYNDLYMQLKKDGIHMYAQSIGGSKMKLLHAYLENSGHSLLIGTDSFWEGVDIPGEKLKYVVIHKFPFQVPTDPIYEARSSLFKDPFQEYAIPKAILKLQQGFGRLIRTKNDTGMVILLDNRILDTKWGEQFFYAFPKNINKKQAPSSQFLQILGEKNNF